ncbi:MAG: response regulator transcription factor [Campylobacterota bacterium]|nr:response regulator transcription factor [Campylobacterota bacterium]
MSLYRVLFVEDEKAIRENYVRYLSKHFKEVYEAEDGEEAYEIYKEKRPELLIIDINIPKLNGLDLLRKIRETDRETKAIMLTAHTDVKYLMQAVELQLTKYLVKPISRQDLKEDLSSALKDLQNFTVKSNKLILLKEKYTWENEKKELLNNGKLVNLTKTELEIFSCLFENVNEVTTYEECIWKVWGGEEYNKIDAFKTLIKNLRKKLPPNTIENVFGVGYKLCV